MLSKSLHSAQYLQCCQKKNFEGSVAKLAISIIVTTDHISDIPTTRQS